MALETCFRAWALHAPAAGTGSKDRLGLVVGSSGSGSNQLVLPSKRAAVAPLSVVGRVVATRRARHVCQSKNAVDEGTHARMFRSVSSVLASWLADLDSDDRGMDDA